VSDLGRVRSVDRVIAKRWRGGRIVYARLKGRLLKLHTNNRGYLYCFVGQARYYAHYLVLTAFTGPRPAGCQAAHGDGDKLNNALGNLRWASPRENNADKIRHGTHLFGAKTPNGRKTHCMRGHRFDSRNTKWLKGRRNCRTCLSDQQRRARGTPPSRFRTPVEPRLSEALRLMAAGMSATQAAQIARVGRSTLARARRPGAHR
jgi:hypothetical protein